MAEQKAKARAAWSGSGEAADAAVWFDIAEREGATEFTGYAATSGEGTVVAIVKDGAEVQNAKAGDDDLGVVLICKWTHPTQLVPHGLCWTHTCTHLVPTVELSVWAVLYLMFPL